MKAGGPGRLTKSKGARRDEYEEALALLWRTSRDLDETALRIEQAIRRSTSVTDVLAPALDRVRDIRARVIAAKTIIARQWAEQQSRRWE